MSACADSSLIVPLYLQETNSAAADNACRSVAAPILLTDWHRVEVASAFQRAVRNGRITAPQAALVWQDFQTDIAAGRFQVASINHTAVLARSLTLTQTYSATTGARTLDLIHVASALELGATQFLSLDQRQRIVAASEGLKVGP